MAGTTKDKANGKNGQVQAPQDAVRATTEAHGSGHEHGPHDHGPQQEEPTREQLIQAVQVLQNELRQRGEVAYGLFCERDRLREYVANLEQQIEAAKEALRQREVQLNENEKEDAHH